VRNILQGAHCGVEDTTPDVSVTVVIEVELEEFMEVCGFCEISCNIPHVLVASPALHKEVGLHFERRSKIKMIIESVFLPKESYMRKCYHLKFKPSSWDGNPELKVNLDKDTLNMDSSRLLVPK